MFQFHHPSNILLKLSKIVPVRFYAVYGFESHPGRERATWWQWRDHVLRHRTTPVGAS